MHSYRPWGPRGEVHPLITGKLDRIDTSQRNDRKRPFGNPHRTGTICVAGKPKFRTTMKTGKAIKQDPRSAPDKAPAEAPEVMSKPMPEYPMNKSELVYPGEHQPFTATDARNTPAGGPHHPGVPAHPEAPPTEQPQNKTHLMLKETPELIEVLTACAAACERSVSACEHDAAGSATCSSTSRACADMCNLLLGYLRTAKDPAIAMMAKDLAPVCARTCEACALECSKHSDKTLCAACEQACRACAAQCRSFAL